MASRRVGSLVLIAAMCVCPGLSRDQKPAERATLAAILAKAEAYCRRLEGAALDFVCLEEVTELSFHFTPSTDVYLYDYQFVRKDKDTKEQRKLLTINGKKSERQDEALKTVMFQYASVLFGPIGLLSKFWQSYHSYKIVGRETAAGAPVAVIDALPAAVTFEPHCYGRAWVREDDGSVLKIVWDEKSVGNYEAAAEWAKSRGCQLQVTAFSEYGVEKNGLRFPSRNFSELANLFSDKSRTVGARMSAVYKKYRFFTVETQVNF